MTLDRRAFLAAAPSLLAWPAAAQPAPDPLMDYERRSGGRVGLYAENIETGAKVVWRADERFVMCSTFKASLAAADPSVDAYAHGIGTVQPDGGAWAGLANFVRKYHIAQVLHGGEVTGDLA